MLRCLTSSLLCLFVSSVAVLQPSADSPSEQEEGAVHLPAVRRQHRPADDDPHLAQLSGGVHQQLALQLGRQQLVRTPFSRRDQVQSTCKQTSWLSKENVGSNTKWSDSWPSQPLVQLPSSHQPRGVPAAVVPAARSQRLRPHAAPHSTVAVLLRCPPTPPHRFSHVRLPQQLQLWGQPGKTHSIIFEYWRSLFKQINFHFHVADQISEQRQVLHAFIMLWLRFTQPAAVHTEADKWDVIR